MKATNYNLNSVMGRTLADNLAKDMSNVEMIEHISTLRNGLVSSNLTYFRRHKKSENTCTVYNEYGIERFVNFELNKAIEMKLTSVTCRRQFTFASSELRREINFYEIRLARRLFLKVFNNGKLYADSKTKIDILVKEFNDNKKDHEKE